MGLIIDPYRFGLVAGTVHTGTTPNTTTTLGAGLTVMDRGLTVGNGLVIYSIGAYLTSAATITVKAALENSTTAYDFVVSESFSHPGGGWADKILTTPYQVPGSGTYRVGAFMTGTADFNNTGNRSQKSGDLSGSQTGFSAQADGVIGLRWTEGV